MFKSLVYNGKRIKLYYHKTDGGAEYLTDTYILCDNKHREGHVTSDTKVCIRIDGNELSLIRV